jgi:hypothetical protein
MTHLACLTAGDCCSKAGCLTVAGAPWSAAKPTRSPDCCADWSYKTAFPQAARRSGVSCKRILLRTPARDAGLVLLPGSMTWRT